MSLTAKQELFVNEYLIDLNATQAAIRSGYSKNTASEIGYENLRKPQIIEAIKVANAERALEAKVTPAMVLKELAKIAFVDIRKAFDENGHLLSIPDMPEDIARAIAGVDLSTYTDKDGNNELTKKIKLIDKKGSLELLGKHLKLFTDKVEHTGKDGTDLIPETSDMETARRVAFILTESAETCH